MRKTTAALLVAGLLTAVPALTQAASAAPAAASQPLCIVIPLDVLFPGARIQIGLCP